MNIGCELPTAVCVAKEVAGKGENDADNLERDVPTRANNLRS